MIETSDAGGCCSGAGTAGRRRATSFSAVVEAHIADFDSTQLDRFEALLECTDPDLFDWIIGGFPAPEEHDHDVMRLLRAFALRRTRKN